MKIFKDKLDYFNLSHSIFIIFCLISIWGSLVYRLYELNWIGTIITLILVIISFFILQQFGGKFNHQENHDISAKTFTLWTLPYLAAAALCFGLLIYARTSDSIISPWQKVPQIFFAVYFLSSLYLLFLSLKNKVNILLSIIHYLLAFSVIWLVYKIGYGYDFFIHQATMQLIDKNGEVLPKPFYYLGQYSLFIIIHKLTGISLLWLNRLFVPVLSAILLPYYFFRSMEKNKIYLPVIISALAFPFAFLTFTTPQNYSYLLLLITIIYCLQKKEKIDYLTAFIMAAATASVHPIAGLPAIIFVATLWVSERLEGRIKKIFLTVLFIFNAVSLPSAFYLISGGKIDFSWFRFENFISLPAINFADQDDIILNFVYFIISNSFMFLALLVISALFIYFKTKNKPWDILPYLSVSGSLFLSYGFAKLISFDYLIDYERQDYIERILLEAIIFLAPLFLLLLKTLIDRIILQEKTVRSAWLIFIGILMTTSLYSAYPRYDDYYNSHGLSTGKYDIEAVNWINENSKHDYIVLANQQVSVAALYEFGFSKYYGDIFYYPIPTGGRLYQYYLDMVYKQPDRRTMFKAMDLANVKEGYFILNKYWWAFPKILAEAKFQADSWQAFGNGQVYVFKYSKN